MLNQINRSYCIYILATFVLFLAMPDEVSAKDEVKAFKVEVSMKSGMHCDAVVSSKTFLPLLKKNEALDMSRLDPEASLTLFYLHGMNGKMVVKLKDIKEMRGLEPLTEKKLAEFTGKIQQRVVTSDKKEEVGSTDVTPEPGEETPASDETVTPQPQNVIVKKEQKEEEVLEWLNRFPLEEGWKPETKKELYERGVTIGVYPSEEEQAFLDHYKEWMKDYNIYLERQKEKATEAEDARKEAEKANLTWLERFPVKAGWGAARKEQIMRKVNHGDVKPTSEEKAFLKHYSEWNAQYTAWKKRNKR